MRPTVAGQERALVDAGGFADQCVVHRASADADGAEAGEQSTRPAVVDPVDDRDDPPEEIGRGRGIESEGTRHPREDGERLEGGVREPIERDERPTSVKSSCRMIVSRVSTAVVSMLLVVGCGSDPGAMSLPPASDVTASDGPAPTRGSTAPVTDPAATEHRVTTTMLPVMPATTIVPAPGPGDEDGSPIEPTPVTEPCPTSAPDATTAGSGGQDAMLDEQFRLEPMLGQVMGYLAEHPGVAGRADMVWHGPGDASVFVSFVGDLEPHRTALRAGVGFPDELIVCQTSLNQDDARRLEARLTDEFAGSFVSLGQGANGITVGLPATAVDVAADLDARYGDAVSLTVGALAYPIQTASAVCPDPTPERSLPDLDIAIAPPAGPLEPDELGQLPAEVTLTNTGSAPVRFSSGAASGEVRDAQGRVVAAQVLGVADVAIGVDLAPGESTTLALSVNVASCDPALGYALAPGEYELVAVVAYLPDLGKSDGAAADDAGGGDRSGGDLTSPPLTFTLAGT